MDGRKYLKAAKSIETKKYCGNGRTQVFENG